jgi:hypothetical protein
MDLIILAFASITALILIGYLYRREQAIRDRQFSNQRLEKALEALDAELAQYDREIRKWVIAAGKSS